MPPQWVFLDRDGTINRSPPPHRYVTRAEDLHLLPGAAEAIARLNEAGRWVGIVTNQRGLGRGCFTRDDLGAVHRRLGTLLARHGAHVDGIWVCPHLEGECECRKPKPGLLHQAARDVTGLDLSRAAIVGDSETDVAAGTAAGVITVRLGSQQGEAAFVASDLASAVRTLLAL